MNQVEELSIFVEQNFQTQLNRYIFTLQDIESQLEDAKAGENRVL